MQKLSFTFREINAFTLRVAQHDSSPLPRACKHRRQFLAEIHDLSLEGREVEAQMKEAIIALAVLRKLKLQDRS